MAGRPVTTAAASALGLLAQALLFLTPPTASAQELDAIPGARDWKMEAPLPGVPYTACVARAEGPQADSVLSLTTAGQPVLTVGRPEWRDLTGAANVAVSIDGAPPETIAAAFTRNLVLATLEDAAQLKRLRAATTLDWALPTGRFRANVAGLGVALDAVLACRANGPLTAR